MIDYKKNKFLKLDYLKEGNSRQKKAFETLISNDIFNLLEDFDPILTGTIPIEIDISKSDLDIICNVKNHEAFQGLLKQSFSGNDKFKININSDIQPECTVANFYINGFDIEIFGQNKPTIDQNAYKHMLIEYQILKIKGTAFKNEIIQMKKEGLKTEPAFAKLLGIKGDPYIELLKYSDW